MSDKDINKVHELVEHEDQKTFNYMLQGKDNGRIKLGKATDNSDIVQETPKKKKERELTDLLLKQAAMDALEDADKAISGMGAALFRMQENYNKTTKYIDRADYLKDQLLHIDSLLKNGSEQEKLLYLLEQGYTEEQLSAIEADGSVNKHLDVLGADMANEYMSLREKIERQAELFAQDTAEYNVQKNQAELAYNEAKALGADQDELDKRQAEIDNLDTAFKELENQYGQAILEFKNEHENFDTVYSVFREESPDSVEYGRLGDEYLDRVEKTTELKAIDLNEDFKRAVSFEETKSEPQFDATQITPKINPNGIDF